MQKFSRPILAVMIAVLALGACGKNDKKDDEATPASTPASAQGPLSGNAPVDIVNYEFKPQKVVVKAGTTVTWTNRDTAIHDIKDTSPLATPQSKDLAKGDTFTITYAQPGTYSYICGIHQYMTGSVEVVP
ncbi:MAG TPA: cupredoxin domain-containing protein [Acidimicrobiia bacterium]|nr:cupredoxin domain-containing protein [Acidimicrobiia bacterium]